MRISSFHFGTTATYGMATTAGLAPAPEAFRTRYPDLRAVLAAGALAELAAATRDVPLVPAGQVRFDPVIPSPSRILCVGINYLEHIHEMGRERPDYPTLFVRFPDSLVGHEMPVIRPRLSTQYDYEGELAVIIGQPARYVPASEALQYVAGYTCFLDGSVRDWQRHTTQFIPGKNFPATGSCGPWLVTTDELPDPAAMQLRTRVNGEELQSAPTSDLCFGVPEIIAYCSSFCPLQPGDIIATGTPSGVGFARKPPRWLKAGDRVEVELTGVGILRNTVADEA